MNSPTPLPTPRYLAAEAVVAVLLDGRSLSEMMESLPPGRERAATQDLAYGTLRRAGRLQFFLSRLINRDLDPPDLIGPLLVGLYELDGSQTPSHAAVNEAVETVAQIAPRARGLANAVLRNFIRRQAELTALAEADPIAQSNLPPWWLARLQRDWPQDWRAMVDTLALHPPMTLRVNTRQSTRDDFRLTLSNHAMPSEITGECALTLERPCAVSVLPGFAAGTVSVQDAAAQYAAPLLDLMDGMRVLDACAAPGGKTAHVLERHRVALTAIDSDAWRMRRVRENLDRLGLTAELITADAANPAAWWDGQPFDRILLDAPCTGSGMVRRHPDARWLKREADIPQLAKSQARLLANLWPLLRPGGKLLYATCSVFRPENHDQVAAFLATHPDARREPLDLPGADDGQLLPTRVHDGFFYARLCKD
jgi:16S rRNA (cytosine967-C5)-methyltransferase